MDDGAGHGSPLASPPAVIRVNILPRPGQGGRYVLLAAGIFVMLWLAGFCWFLAAARDAPDLPARADGIVVLTGGADRVGAALRLLAENRADRLLVTGIGGGAPLRDLAEHSDLDLETLAGRVTLGRGATSTRGNATETAAWVRTNGMKSLVVVTAFYHMPRAMTELRRVLAGVRLYRSPVQPPGMRRLDGLGTWTGIRVLAEEYCKLIAAKLSLTAWEWDRGPVLSEASSGRPL